MSLFRVTCLYVILYILFDPVFKKYRMKKYQLLRFFYKKLHKSGSLLYIPNILNN